MDVTYGEQDASSRLAQGVGVALYMPGQGSQSPIPGFANDYTERTWSMRTPN